MIMRSVPKFACPHCGQRVSRVVGGRPKVHPNGRTVKRVRLCVSCCGTFTTTETVDSAPPEENRDISRSIFP